MKEMFPKHYRRESMADCGRKMEREFCLLQKEFRNEDSRLTVFRVDGCPIKEKDGSIRVKN